MGSLAAGSAAAMGTGALSAEITGRDASIQVSGDTGSLIQLIPGHHDNDDSSVSDDRVYINDGQLGISFSDETGGSGINPNSTYQVGAIGSDAQEALNVLPNRPAQSDVLYGEAESGSETTYDDPAFYLQNSTDNEHKIEITWEEDSSPRDEGDVNAENAGAAFVSDASEVEAYGDATRAGFVLSLDGDGGENGSAYSGFTVGSGEKVGLSLIAALGDVNPDTNWSGTLKIRVGEIADNTV